ncbi:hypothetical protein AURDEDRAFT_180326 [Auricularia subglabra TFB-10046 SS5]|nr:hypothetical protein AURDEDRAFT_180326 [Auricularia subglabra TFB-10046 SS5]
MRVPAPIPFTPNSIRSPPRFPPLEPFKIGSARSPPPPRPVVSVLKVSENDAAANWKAYGNWGRAFKRSTHPDGSYLSVECRGNRLWQRDVFIPADQAGNGDWVEEPVFMAWLLALCRDTGQPVPYLCLQQTELKTYLDADSSASLCAPTANAPTTRGKVGVRLFGGDAAGSAKPAQEPTFEVPSEARLPPHEPPRFNQILQPVCYCDPALEGRVESCEPSGMDEDTGSLHEEEEEQAEDVEMEDEESKEGEDDDDDDGFFPETPGRSPGQLLTLSCGFGLQELGPAYWENFLQSPAPKQPFKRKAAVLEEPKPERKRRRLELQSEVDGMLLF